MEKPKVLAINLPQFHPNPDNDEWWGKGFTEWTNVTKTKPLFEGHYQPQLPTDLGFYDMRLPETIKEQANLAKEYNIDGFCYYHYWFSGKRLLNEPIDLILDSKKPDFPFCYFWANETWSRRWMGEEKEVLIKQEYSHDDDRNHANWLMQSFKDERYIKIDGRPIFIIYKPFDLPNPQKTMEIFEEVCKENGLKKPYFIASNSHDMDKNPYELGFDHALNFQPRLQVLSEFMVEGPTLKKFIRNISNGVINSKLRLYTYKYYKDRIKNLEMKYSGFPCVLVGFDNTARRGGNAIVLKDQSVELFEESLIEAKKQALELKDGEKIVFINAWNEWAEGNHLEPCRNFGRQFLEAVKRVFPN
jgi:lipopolysaccharide biosynthesis protein